MGTKVSANALTPGRSVCSACLCTSSSLSPPTESDPLGPVLSAQLSNLNRTAQPCRVESFSPINTEPFACSNGIA